MSSVPHQRCNMVNQPQRAGRIKFAGVSFDRLRHRGWSGGLHRGLLWHQVARLRAAGPTDDLKAAVEVLDHGGAAFDPVAAIDVAAAGIIPDHRMMDMTANDAVDAVPFGFGGDCLLVMADEVDGVLDLQL